MKNYYTPVLLKTAALLLFFVCSSPVFSQQKNLHTGKIENKKFSPLYFEVLSVEKSRFPNIYKHIDNPEKVAEYEVKVKSWFEKNAEAIESIIAKRMQITRFTSEEINELDEQKGELIMNRLRLLEPALLFQKEYFNNHQLLTQLQKEKSFPEENLIPQVLILFISEKDFKKIIAD